MITATVSTTSTGLFELMFDDDGPADELPGEKPLEPEVSASAATVDTAQSPSTEPEPHQNDAARAAMAERSRWRERLDRLENEHSQELERLRNELADLKKPKQAEPEPINFEDNPAEFLRQQTVKTSQEIENLRKESDALRQQAVFAESERRYAQDVQHKEQVFVAENPDYYEALEYVRGIERQKISFYPDKVIHDFLKQNNLQITDSREDNISKVISVQEWNGAKNLLALGLNPVQQVYEMARMQGYTKKADEQKQAKAEQDLDRLEKSMKHSTNVSGGSAVEENDNGVMDIDALLAARDRSR